MTRSEPSGGSGSPTIVTGVVFSGGTSQAEYAIPTMLDVIQNPVAAAVEYERAPDALGGVGGLLYSVRGGVPKFDVSDGRGDVVGQTDQTANLTLSLIHI